MARPIARDLARTRRRDRGVALHPLGEPATCSGRRAADRPRNPPEPQAEGRPHVVLLPVPAAGRAVLRGAPVPVRRAWTVCDRNGGPAPAALDHAPTRRGRY